MIKGINGVDRRKRRKVTSVALYMNSKLTSTFIVDKTMYCYSHLYIQYMCTCRQAEFLHDVGVVLESTSGIDQWWIGLSDMSKYK
jgi:hypothetical protein